MLCLTSGVRSFSPVIATIQVLFFDFRKINGRANTAHHDTRFAFEIEELLIPSQINKKVEKCESYPT